MICSHCGKELPDNAKFCDGCGSKVIKDNRKVHENRCRYCNAIIPSNASVCPYCGNEVIDKEINSYLKKMSIQLMNINDNKKKVSFIRNLILPKSVNDLKEFVIYIYGQYSNADIDGDKVLNNEERALSNAWKIKLEECIELGLNYKDLSSENKEFFESYKKKVKETKLAPSRKHRKLWMVLGIVGGGIFVVFILPYILLAIVAAIGNANTITDKDCNFENKGSQYNVSYRISITQSEYEYRQYDVYFFLDNKKIDTIGYSSIKDYYFTLGEGYHKFEFSKIDDLSVKGTEYIKIVNSGDFIITLGLDEYSIDVNY